MVFGKKRTTPKSRKAPRKRKERKGANTASRNVLRALLCVVLFAILCVPAVFVNSTIGYAPALFFAFMIVLCYAYCRICSRAFSFDELAKAASCVRGGSVDVLLRIRNASMLFAPRVDVDFAVHDLFGNETSADTATIAVNPRATQDFDFGLSFGHIGQFDVGLHRLVVHDPLGLFKRTIPVDSVCSITVTPRLHEVDDIPLSDAAVKQVSEALRSSNNPGSDYCGVRDYVPGDPMKLIHWKLSARSFSYYTKLYEEQSEPSLDIYLDVNAPDYDHETLMDIYDAALETSLSLEAYAQENGLETRMLFLNAQGDPEQFLLAPGSDFRDLMRQLPAITPASSDEFQRFLFKSGTSLQAADNIAVCSANVSEGMAEALIRIRGTQRNVLMFALMPSGLPEEQTQHNRASLRTLDNAGITTYQVKAGGGRL